MSREKFDGKKTQSIDTTFFRDVTNARTFAALRTLFITLTAPDLDRAEILAAIDRADSGDGTTADAPTKFGLKSKLEELVRERNMADAARATTPNSLQRLPITRNPNFAKTRDVNNQGPSETT